MLQNCVDGLNKSPPRIKTIAWGILRYREHKNMIIIAFSNKTSKFLPRIFCRKFKHVAPIIMNDNKITLYQFILKGNITQIQLKMRDLKILMKHGWKFIYLNSNARRNFNASKSITCVQFTKNIIGMRNLFVQTPYQMYKTLKKIP